jgi:hypothetical protein
VSFAAITFCVASQRVFTAVSVYFIMTQSGNFWIHSRTYILSNANGGPTSISCSSCNLIITLVTVK